MRFNDFINELRANMARDNDNVIVIDGYEGTGKSNLAILLNKSLVPSFDPSKEAIFTVQDWNRIFNTGQTQRAYQIDEAGNLLFSRDYASTDSKFLVKLLMQARILKSTIVMCLPNIGWLEKYVREHRVRWRIHMFNRTSAMLQRGVVNWRTGGARFEDVGRFTGIPSTKTLWPELWSSYEERKIAAVQAFSGDHQKMLRLNKLSQDARIRKLEAELDA